MLGIGDVAPAGKLLRFLSMLAAALSVSLSHHRAVCAARFADAPRGENDVDRGEAVLDAVRVMLDPARVHEKARLRGAPHFRGGPDRLLRDAGDVRGVARRPLPDVLRERVEAGGVLLDEFMID